MLHISGIKQYLFFCVGKSKDFKEEQYNSANLMEIEMKVEITSRDVSINLLCNQIQTSWLCIPLGNKRTELEKTVKLAVGVWGLWQKRPEVFSSGVLEPPMIRGASHAFSLSLHRHAVSSLEDKAPLKGKLRSFPLYCHFCQPATHFMRQWSADLRLATALWTCVLVGETGPQVGLWALV